MPEITPQRISKMSYLELMTFLGEVNRPPGGKDFIRRVVQNCFITKESRVLDIGCNTGYCSFEITHLTKCHVVGIDTSPQMIKQAKKFQRNDPLGNLIEFKIVDAMKLPFGNEEFDVVVSGGSTAFIDDKEKALQEYKRVLKPWGFIADINFYYKIKPPLRLIKDLNNLMDINIQSWGIQYWFNLYEKAGLEKYFIFLKDVEPVTRQKIDRYCIEMVKEKKLPKETEKILIKRLTSIMSLFNENHKYLASAIFIMRKRLKKEQIFLFNP